MYVTLAARPLPRWFHLILSVLLFNLSCAVVYVYVASRNITSSTGRFEPLPSYVVAVLFFFSGCLSLAMTKSLVNENLRVAQLGVMLSLATVVIASTVIVCTLLLTDIQDKYVSCVFDMRRLQCRCRLDNRTDAADEWYVYEHISGCYRLESLNRCMIAAIALDALGAFVCFLAFCNFGLIWVRRKHDQNRGLDSTLTAGGLDGDGSSTVNGGGVYRHPSPMAGVHSDWDSWLLAHPVFRRMFTELRHVWFPPSYDISENSHRHSGNRPDSAASSGGGAESPELILPPPPQSCSPHFQDYPPPPYSKSPQKLPRHFRPPAQTTV